MRLKPKKLGDDLTLDEYNALQYLLYKITITDTVSINTAVYTQGKYAKYKLKANDELIPNDKENNVRINRDIKNTDKLEILVEKTQSYLPLNEYGNCEVTLYYKPVRVEPSEDESEDVEYQPTDYYDLKEWLDDEAHKKPSLDDYEKIILTAFYDGDKLSIPLYQSGKPLFKKTTLINKTITFTYSYNKKPQIDTLNGAAPNINEILLDAPVELQRMVQYAPNNNKECFIRLNSNNLFKLTKTITVKNGQHIKIMGGTNANAVIDGSDVGRSFIVQPGGKLTLQNLSIVNNDATQTEYEKGLGSVALVEHSKTSDTYGYLTMRNVNAAYNKARSGGVIHAQHACVTLHNCEFYENTATMEGGAITYRAIAVRMKFNTLIAVPGSTVKLKIDVLDYSNKPLTKGTVRVYSMIDGDEQQLTDEIGNYDIPVDGEQISIPVNIPENVERPTVDIRTEYEGDEELDDDVDYAKIYLKKVEKFTSVLTDTSINVTRGSVLTLKATVFDKNKDITTTPDAVFTFNGKTFIAQKINNAYVVKTYVGDLIDGEYPYQFILEGENIECPVATGKVTVTQTPRSMSDNTTSLITGLYVTEEVTYTKALELTQKGFTDIYYKVDDSRDIVAMKSMMEVTNKSRLRYHAVISVFKDVYTNNFMIDQEHLDGAKHIINQIIKTSSVSGIVFDNIRFSGLAEKTTNEPYIKKAMQDLYDYIKAEGNYTVSATVLPEYNTAKNYGQTIQNTADIVDYTIPLLKNGDYNANIDWIGTSLKKIQGLVGTHKILPMIQSYENYSKQEAQDISIVNNKVKQVADNNSIGVIIDNCKLLKAYPKPFNEY